MYIYIDIIMYIYSYIYINQIYIITYLYIYTHITHSFLITIAIAEASLALLPQSPDGRSAWSVLLGRESFGCRGGNRSVKVWGTR